MDHLLVVRQGSFLRRLEFRELHLTAFLSHRVHPRPKPRWSVRLDGNLRPNIPELEKYGGTVAGKGKPPYVGGTQIPPTHVDVIRKPEP
jgi:hypothetical protein